jgi:hypothetical protein
VREAVGVAVRVAVGVAVRVTVAVLVTVAVGVVVAVVVGVGVSMIRALYERTLPQPGTHVALNRVGESRVTISERM